MKLKATTIGLLAALVLGSSLQAAASNSSDSMHARRRQTPPKTQPSLPSLPPQPGTGGPTLPTLPGNPTIPSLPTMPPPGRGNPQGGPEVPFPLAITLPFPWGSIEGVWKVITSDGSEILFSFAIETDRDGHSFLRVQQVDGTSGVDVAEGVGISVESDKLVRAAMKSKTGGSYMLFIGSYKNTNQFVVGGTASKSITVLTVRPFTDLMGAKDVQVIVQKVSNTPYGANQCPLPANDN